MSGGMIPPIVVVLHVGPANHSNQCVCLHPVWLGCFPTAASAKTSKNLGLASPIEVLDAD